MISTRGYFAICDGCGDKYNDVSYWYKGQLVEDLKVDGWTVSTKTNTVICDNCAEDLDRWSNDE